MDSGSRTLSRLSATGSMQVSNANMVRRPWISREDFIKELDSTLVFGWPSTQAESGVCLSSLFCYTSRLLMLENGDIDEDALAAALSLHEMHWRGPIADHGIATTTDIQLNQDIVKAINQADRRGLDELRERCIALEKEVADLSQSMDDANKYHQERYQQLRKNFNHHRSERKAEKKAKAEDDKRHKMSRTDLQKRNKTLTREKDKLSAKNTELELRIYGLDDRITQQDELRERNDVLSVEKAKVLAEKIKLNGDLNRQRAEWEAERRALAQANAEEEEKHSRRCMVLEELNADLASENKQLLAETDESRGDIERLSEEHRSQMAALLHENAEFRKEQQGYGVLEKRADALRHERDDLLAVGTEYQSELEKQAVEREEERADFMRRKAEEDRRNEQRYNELQESCGHLIREKEAADSERAVLREELACRVIELEETQKLLKRASARAAEQNLQHYQDLETRNAVLAGENSKLKDENTSLLGELQCSFVEKNAETSRLQQENAVLSHKKDALQVEKDILKRRLLEEHKNLRQRCERLEIENLDKAQLKGELASSKEMVAYLTERLKVKVQDEREADERWIGSIKHEE